ncbi:hypothetical protein M3591_14910 [Exiguobacterium sp. MER 193]|uniref:hypothetical protein n=1 Tax=Exiguobacterium sp. MER 193 TaxID=2939564 RepID=UPI00203BD0CE|nr:hypothetical protein [Exiguobacterium sp. MER 193]MCM3281781.1 hypothetical protein [Exiguobacterium sp. MER 193]
MKFFNWKTLPFLMSFGVGYWLISLSFYTSTVTNFGAVLSAGVGLGSSILGFLIAAITLLISGIASKFYEQLIKLKTDKKILRWIMASIVYSFIFSITSLLGLVVIDTNPSIELLIYTLWSASLFAVIQTNFMVIFSLSVIVKNK